MSYVHAVEEPVDPVEWCQSQRGKKPHLPTGVKIGERNSRFLELPTIGQKCFGILAPLFLLLLGVLEVLARGCLVVEEVPGNPGSLPHLATNNEPNSCMRLCIRGQTAEAVDSPMPNESYSHN
jgi:hypothetical protein